MMLQVKMGIHDLNHKTRRKLKGRNACQVYFNKNRQVYSRRKQKQIFDWIKKLAVEISAKDGMDKISPDAWRYACRKWIKKKKWCDHHDKEAESVTRFFFEFLSKLGMQHRDQRRNR